MSDLRTRIIEAAFPLTPENIKQMVLQLVRDDVELILHYHGDQDAPEGSEENLCTEVYLPEHVRLVFVHALELVCAKLVEDGKMGN